MKEGRKDLLIFAGAVFLLLGTALGIKRFTGGSTAPAPVSNVYVGHYGFSVTLPEATAARMQMFGAFTNEQKTSEVVFVFPRTMKQDEPFNVAETRYKEYGIVRLEVNPNKSFPKGTDVLAAAKFAVGATLKEKKEAFRVTDIRTPLPGFVIDISSPTALRQVFLKGERVHYLFTGDPENPALAQSIDGLAELTPHDEPGK